MFRKCMVPEVFVILCGIILSGCSYIFLKEVKGSYEGGRGVMVGYMTMYFSDHSKGNIALGSIDRQDCQGEFLETDSGISVFGRMANVMRYYEGDLICLEGRKGRFKLETRDGQTGKIVGQIEGRHFELHIQPTSERQRYSYGDDWRGPSEIWRESMKRQRTVLN